MEVQSSEVVASEVIVADEASVVATNEPASRVEVVNRISTTTTEAAEAVEEVGDLAGEITTNHSAIAMLQSTSEVTGP